MKKRIYDMTDEELLALQADAISWHIDLECAEAGAPLLPPEPGPKPEKPDVAPDLVVWSIKADLSFTDREEAQAVLDMAAEAKTRCQLNYVPGPGYEKKVEPAERELALERGEHYSETRYANIKGDLAAYNQAVKEHEAETKEYREASKKREACAERVQDVIGEARERLAHKARVEGEWKQYKELAGGMHDLAASFLFKAHPTWDTDEVRGWLGLPLLPKEADGDGGQEEKAPADSAAG